MVNNKIILIICTTDLKELSLCFLNYRLLLRLGHRFVVPGYKVLGIKLGSRGTFLFTSSRCCKYLSYSSGSISTLCSASLVRCCSSLVRRFSSVNELLLFSWIMTENMAEAEPEPYENKQTLGLNRFTQQMRYQTPVKRWCVHIADFFGEQQSWNQNKSKYFIIIYFLDLVRFETGLCVSFLQQIIFSHAEKNI
ncbi:hypothetical protein BpHYR1_036201 [Brachionus plicatilis]|uniref:Uncharacterized protein n=1 Tax=Brachionus plicatilis TaxID=10195 RepID=A0A3M7RK16_BRAPC|nr:hypothetical protein BpHYR1_036201 [Brachionus plicatilis]